MQTLAQGAEALASRGFKIFPCKPRDKVPAVPWKSLATSDLDVVRAWWGPDGGPELNIGLVTGAASGVWVLDVDGPEGEAGLRDLLRRHGDDVSATMIAETARGRHVYFRMPPCTIPNSAGMIGAKLDVRGDGGYVVAPPSVHQSGHVYRWLVDGGVFIDAPEWLIELATAKRNGSGVKRDWGAVAGVVPEGQRNATLASIAGKLVGHMLEPRLVNTLLQAFNGRDANRHLIPMRLNGSLFRYSRRKGGGTMGELDEWERRQRERSPQIKLVPWHEIRLPEAPPYLVHGIIPATGLTLIWGPPKQGKSFVTLDMMMHVARDDLTEYRGRAVMHGPVVYCAFEGQAGYGKRLEAYRIKHSPRPDTPFWLMPSRLDLVADHQALGDAVAGISPAPVAIVLDTLNRSFAGSESRDGDMSAWVDAADYLRERFECAVIIVHHCGIETSRPRGHTSLKGAVACEASVKQDVSGKVIMTVESMRDGEAGDVIASRLEVVTVGDDTSCVVVPTEFVHDKAEAKKARLGNSQKLALEALVSLVAKSGMPLPQAYDLPPSIRAVPFEAWRAELFARNIVERDGSNPRARIKELRDALKAKCVAAERGDWIWPIL